jgi:hypothetical protein
MHIYLNRTELERAVVLAGRQLPAMLPGEYAGRVWLALVGVDPATAQDVLLSGEAAAAVPATAAEALLDGLAELGVALVQEKQLPRGLVPYRGETALTVLRRALNAR